ncbi:MAG TPA: AIPR family protein [Terriglobia bacterium]|nr:AIPR family protein [Terriglobia bacterium]
MELNEFRKDFLEQIAAIAAAEGNYRHSAFVSYSAQLLEDAEEVADFEECYFRGTGFRQRALAVDGFAFDSADGSVRLFVAEFSGEDEPETLTQTQAKTEFARLQAFCEDALLGRLHNDLEESSPSYGLAQTLHQQRGSLSRLRLYLLTDVIMSSRIRDWPEDSIADVRAEFHIWDIARFYRAWESKTGKDDLEVDFTELVPGGLPCLPASVEADEYRAYLCVVPGVALADIYDKFGSRLLEGNVRSFLTTRGRVNKAIRQTILNRPRMFFAYNNGIACTASSAEVVKAASGLKLLRASDLQIVNGGQTTASLASGRRNDRACLEHTFVQMKLSVIPPETSGQIIPEISRCANSQNKVSEADFFSNHEFHRRMEQIARRLWAPATAGAQHETHWFYERARGQYLNEQSTLTPAEKRRFVLLNPRQQVITKTDLAKYENSWREMPHIVSQGAQKNFLAFSVQASQRWAANQDEFNEEFFKRSVAKAIVFRSAERLVSKQPWYQGGYRANVVAYTVSKLSQLIESEAGGKVMDFRATWTKQGLSPALEAQIAKIADAMFKVIVNPEGGFQNVTEWCKKELCWKRAADVRVQLLTEFADELISQSEDIWIRHNSEASQKIETSIEKQTTVVKLGASYWKELRKWGLEHGLVSPDDDGILGVAASIPGRIPTEKQSWRLMEIKARLEREGFLSRYVTAPEVG